ncbi:uncharacterized protein Z520_07765 [Fonsecaea multimorphosa CBS 102226]|uniref:Heterokaryon incompatibility domain-containing protein n=1 Tax=Fonsecaea multimorphosa CBS 102226 TaxID=1442371 RepID=A0A0D2K0M2_9EURO|nr:uncharacterized protein Z520_07765 [Fonsecaea multimorphosa CBS 102226]KIX96499.1 hypothetical protein Z520_07765 [Fonsecaea multimorphosa CBS 102226]OAL28301.1 hypothetical protein AYO22_03007 [Fonsecaea multimorphosa]
MDHLPSPDRPLYTPKVPYVCKGTYHGSGIEKYPRRNGWDVLKLLDGELGTHSVDELGSFIQTWLYFGVLADVLTIIGLEFDQSEYIAQLPSGERVVTSLPLLAHISTWQKRAESLAPDERKKQGKQVRQVLEKASLYTNSLLTRTSQPPLTGISDDITLSILVLGSTLFRAASKICLKGLGAHYANNILDTEEFPEAREDEEDISTWAEPYWGFSSLSTARLVEQGWCTRDITMLQDLFSPESIHYITSLGITKIADHSKCTGSTCVGNYVDPEGYQTQHTEAGCECELIGADQDQVVSILEGGGIPVVGFSWYGINRDEPLSIIKSSSSTPYVAISHVWSHGLGNVRTNAIRKCQMIRLWGYFQKLQGMEHQPAETQRFFWLDTLCVPLANDESRKAAIARLTETYREAEIVLVLDQDLQRCPIPTTTEEISMRLGCSDWMRRLWTLKEGVLARNLHLQFLDGVVDLAKERERHEGKVSISDNIGSDSRQLYSDIEILNIAIEGSDFEVTKLIHISNALRYRSTSRTGDEAICIATFLGFHTDRVYDLPPERRIPYLLSHIPQVPRHIMFMAGTKLQDEGYRWAPASFLNRNTSTDTYALTAGSSVPRTTAGLSVEFPGFTIKYGGERLDSVFYMIDRAERVWYKFESARHVYPECDDEPDWEETLSALPSPAVVMPRNLTDADADAGSTLVCALVSQARRDGPTIRVRFEARAFVSRIVQDTMPTELSTILEDPDAATAGRMAICESQSADQSWCIC